MVLGRVDVEALFLEVKGVFLRAAAAQADQGVQLVFFVIGQDRFGSVNFLAAHHHAAGFVAAGAENGAADGEDAGKGALVQGHGAVFHQAAESVAKPDDLHVEGALGGLADAANGSVEAGAIAAGGENADVFGHDFESFLPARRRQRSRRSPKGPGFSR